MTFSKGQNKNAGRNNFSFADSLMSWAISIKLSDQLGNFTLHQLLGIFQKRRLAAIQGKRKFTRK
jgi:hypothetical protein